MDNGLRSFGYKGKGASGTDVTALKRKLAEARSYSQTDKKRGVVRMVDIVSFTPALNIYSQITNNPLGPTESPIVAQFTPGPPLNITNFSITPKNVVTVAVQGIVGSSCICTIVFQNVYYPSGNTVSITSSNGSVGYTAGPVNGGDPGDPYENWTLYVAQATGITSPNVIFTFTFAGAPVSGVGVAIASGTD